MIWREVICSDLVEITYTFYVFFFHKYWLIFTKFFFCHHTNGERALKSKEKRRKLMKPMRKYKESIVVSWRKDSEKEHMK